MTFNSKAFIEQFWRAFNDHSPAAIAALMAEDAVLETSFGCHSWGDRIVGRKAIHDFYVDMFARVPDASWSELRRIVCPSHVVLESLGTGTPRGGLRFQCEICDVLTLRDSVIAAKRSYRKVASL